MWSSIKICILQSNPTEVNCRCIFMFVAPKASKSTVFYCILVKRYIIIWLYFYSNLLQDKYILTLNIQTCNYYYVFLTPKTSKSTVFYCILAKRYITVRIWLYFYSNRHLKQGDRRSGKEGMVSSYGLGSHRHIGLFDRAGASAGSEPEPDLAPVLRFSTA